MGFASYYHYFVQDFSKIASPLNPLIAAFLSKKHRGTSKKPLHEQLSEVCESSSPVLAYADFKKHFIIEIDASHN